MSGAAAASTGSRSLALFLLHALTSALFFFLFFFSTIKFGGLLSLDFRPWIVKLSGIILVLYRTTTATAAVRDFCCCGGERPFRKADEKRASTSAFLPRCLSPSVLVWLFLGIAASGFTKAGKGENKKKTFTVVKHRKVVEKKSMSARNLLFFTLMSLLLKNFFLGVFFFS